jgi:1,4-dihydroxy-2-naphthoyl-CoA synthase
MIGEMIERRSDEGAAVPTPDQTIRMTPTGGAKMESVRLDRHGDVAVVTICRGKVNAINQALLDELNDCFDQMEGDNAVRAIILTGAGTS